MSITQYSYVIINAGIAVFCIIKGYYVFTNRAKSPGIAWPLLGLMLIYAFVSVSELFSYAIIGDTSRSGDIVARISAFVGNAGLFLTVFFASFFLYRLNDIRGGVRRPQYEKATTLICSIGILMVVVSRIIGFYYYIDDQNAYHSTTTYSIHMLIALMAIVPIIIQTIKNRKVFHNREFMTLFATLMCLLVMSVLAMIMMIIIQISLIDNIIMVIIIASFAVIFRMEISTFIVVREGIQLTATNIDLMSEDMAKFMDECGLSSRNSIKARLKMEESLLRLRDRYGEDARINFYTTYLFRRPILKIEITDEPFNPLSRYRDTEIEDWSAGLLNSTGISPTYSYFLGKNQVKLAFPPHRMNSSIKMFFMALVGIIIGFGCTKALPESGAKIISDELLIPAYELLANMLYCVSAPIIFFMIITAVLNTGAISDQGGSSGRLVFRYFMLSASMGLFALIFTFLCGGGHLAPLRTSELWKHDVIDAILSIVPKNILDPIKEVNSLQLMLMALVIGCAVIALGQRGKSLAEFLRQSNLVAMKVAEWIGRLIPYFVMMVVILLMIQGQSASLVNIVWAMVMTGIISCIIAGQVIICVGIKSETKALDLIRKCWPSFKIALKTGSANAAYEDAERCCSDELGIESHYAAEGLPLGTIMYMPINVAAALVYVVMVAINTDVQITPVWMVMAIILTVLLIVATPPIPGANFLPYMIIISQLGIEGKYLIGALLFDVLIGSFAVAVNQIMLQMEMTMQANKIGLIDKDRLHASTR